jgi:xanthine dehydrogenase YagS FAD-binding subunit
MNAFEYTSPATKEQAVSLLSTQWGETEILAGGTDLLSLMKDRLSTPKRVVNIKEIKEFQGITYAVGKGLRLGALSTLEEVVDNAAIRGAYPSLWEAADGVRSPQIRNFGTVGGDLCQRPRCWYFRSGLGYFPKDEEGNDIIPRGENQYHAILGNRGPAYFVNPSSLAPALIALEAKLRLFGPQGWREVIAEEFFVAPLKEGEREYVLKSNEILGEILVPAAGEVRNASYEVREKEALDWPLAAAAAALQMQGSKVVKARLVLGHIAPVPWLSKEAGSVLEGKTVNENLAAEAAGVALASSHPLSKNAYKVQLAKVALKRAILKALQGGA